MHYWKTESKITCIKETNHIKDVKQEKTDGWGMQPVARANDEADAWFREITLWFDGQTQEMVQTRPEKYSKRGPHKWRIFESNK